MPISMTQHAPGMPAQAYEETIANVGQPLRQSEGFISHAAEVTPDGVTVTEVRDPRTVGTVVRRIRQTSPARRLARADRHRTS